MFFNPAQNINLLTNLIAYYDAFDDSVDSVSANNGTQTGATYTTGILNKAFNFTGNPQHVNIPDSDDLSFTDGSGNDVPFTISFWMYTTGYSSTANFIMNKRDGVTNDEWQISSTATSITFFKYSGIPTDRIGILVPSPSLNNWHHFVYVDDGNETYSGGDWYINGSLSTGKGSNNSGTYTGMSNGTQKLRLGLPVWTTSTTLQLQGRLCEIGIWKNRELTPAEITYLYNSGVGKTYPL